MVIAYITVKLPYGPQEAFVIPEVKEIQRRGHKVIMMPLRPDKEIFHRDAEILRENTYRADLISSKVIFCFLKECLRRPVAGLKAITAVISHSTSLKTTFKNITIVPKAFYTSCILRKEKVDHIHAHWASTPSTVAYIASSLAGIPWSFTAHRWDIAENNILETKAASAAFVRTIDENGRKKMIDTVRNKVLSEKIHVLHMGVSMQNHESFDKSNHNAFTMLCPANMVPVKGHDYLLQACQLLVRKGAQIKCLLAGDGPLEKGLRAKAKDMGISDQVVFLGRLPHERLLDMYRRGEIDLVVLPSIETDAGEAEGIPVALVEAMSFGISVVSTHTGGIPELLGRGAGIMVKGKDPQDLADAVETLYNDVSLRITFGAKGRERVEQEFNLEVITGELLKRFGSGKGA